MSRGRLEAFSDGVIAILITIMVLELKTPEGSDWHALAEKLPVFMAYVLSFIYVGIYWSNHHHMFHLVHQVSGRILWANLYLLFWLSLVPFATSWAGEHGFEPLPTAVYGGVLLSAAIAWLILQTALIAEQGPGSKLAEAVGKDLKGKLSALLYVGAIPLAFVNRWIACAIYVIVALWWLVPDRRFEARAAASE